MERQTILVVEDDTAIRKGIVDALTFAGFRIIAAADGTTGLRSAVHAGYDLLLLDLVLPGPDGMEILAETRISRPTVPIIILTARGDETDRVKGLKLGADDYVVKPFSVKELLARIEAVLRRSPERPSTTRTVVLPGVTVDIHRREVRHADGRHEDLSERETEILLYLAGNRGRAISREELLRRVWRLEPENIETRTIDMHVARLREKLDPPRSRTSIIETVHGKGYRLTVSGKPKS